MGGGCCELNEVVNVEEKMNKSKIKSQVVLGGVRVQSRPISFLATHLRATSDE